MWLPSRTTALKLSGPHAEFTRALQAGLPVDVDSTIVADLVDQGVVERCAGVARRSVLRAGALGLGAGVAVLAMPSIAAASSGGCLDGEPVAGDYFPTGDDDWRFVVPDFRLPNGTVLSDLSSLTVHFGSVSATSQSPTEQFGDFRWDIPVGGSVPTVGDVGVVCGNFTVSGVTYRGSFSWSGGDG